MSVRDASESGPAADEEKVGFVARLRRRLKRGAKAADADAADAADGAVQRTRMPGCAPVQGSST